MVENRRKQKTRGTLGRNFGVTSSTVYVKQRNEMRVLELRTAFCPSGCRVVIYRRLFSQSVLSPETRLFGEHTNQRQATSTCIPPAMRFMRRELFAKLKSLCACARSSWQEAVAAVAATTERYHIIKNGANPSRLVLLLLLLLYS